MLEPADIWGVQDFAPTVHIRMVIKTKPAAQFGCCASFAVA